MLGREPLATMPIVANENVFAGEVVALVARDRSGPLFVVFDFSASVLRAGRA